MERRKLTAAEIRTLSRFDVDTRSAFPAARSNYLRSVGREDINILKEIYKAVTGEDFRETASSCSSCELRLQRIICAWYDADKAAVEAKPVAPKKRASKK
ncbi:MAG: hypothetical protein KBS70_04040 [Bacteroidales bacterium]|nr:hypothetical protein [Candidatus Colicola equi]